MQGPGPAATALQGLRARTSPASRALAGLIGAGWALQAASGNARRMLLLVPAKSIIRVWVFATASFVDPSLVSTLCSAISLLALAAALEPIWGTKEFVAFNLVVNGAAFALTSMTLFFGYMVTFDPELIYAGIGGYTAGLAGLLVALRQVMPEQELLVQGVAAMKAKNALFAFLALAFLAAVVGWQPLGNFLLLLFGAFSAWLYLRYVQRKEGEAVRGDPTFSLGTFFPDGVQHHVDGAVDKVEALARSSSRKLWRQGAPSEAAGALPASSEPARHVVVPVNEGDLEAARKRERGQKALAERLAQKAAAMTGGKQPAAEASPAPAPIPGSSAAAAAAEAPPAPAAAEP